MENGGLLKKRRKRRRVLVRPSIEAGLFLAPAPRRCDLAGAHQVTNVFLKKFVVVVELVVLLPHSLDAVEDGEERFLQSLGMPSQLLARLLA